MTNTEINKKAYEKYPVVIDTEYDKYGNAEEIDINEKARNAYIEAYEEISSPTIKCWVGRDDDCSLRVFTREPDWLMDHWRDWDSIIELNCQSFPEVGQGEIIEVELMFRPL